MKVFQYLKLVALAVVLYLLLIPAIYFLQQYLIFQPVLLSENYEYSFNDSFEEIDFEVENGLINSLYFCSNVDSIRGVILYFHGNADNLKRWSQYREVFLARGYDILMMDYRGFGKSRGKIDEANFYKDARVVYNWLSTQFPAKEIVLYGRSLGTAMAAELATHVDAKSVILETPFDNVINVILYRYPIYLPFELDYQFPNYQFVKNIETPIYILEAENDKVVPNLCTENLRPLLKSSDKYIVVEGAGHKNMAEFSEYELHLDRILGKRINPKKKKKSNN